MALGVPTQLQFKPPNLIHHKLLHTHVPIIAFKIKSITINKYFQERKHFYSILSVVPKACNDDGSDFQTTSQQSSVSIDEQNRTPHSTSDGYMALFVRMLGLDNDPLDREQAVVAIWKYCLGGKQYVDNIMQFHGAVNLTVNLLKSDSDAACEAAAGLLRTISAVNRYRDSVAASGAIEEITVLLMRSSLPSNVKEQSVCTLWNLTTDDNLRLKMANSDLLPTLIKLLEDEDLKVKEAAGGVLANLSLSHANHKIMVEAGVVPKLAKVLTTEAEGSKIIRKEARNALLELAKDDYNRILIMEEGLLLVPLVGSAAYSSFKPSLYSWPSLPDGTKIEQSPKGNSKFGASELLLGLNIQEDNAHLEEIKMNAVVGRSQQQFLARLGAIEKEDDTSASSRFTLLPMIDGIARLVLILGLEDDIAVSRAAESIAVACINEYMRVSFKEAGAVKLLVQLSNHPREAVKFAALQALERLSVSNNVCKTIQAEAVLFPLVDLLKQSALSGNMTEVILNILTRILDPAKAMRSKFYVAPVNGSNAALESSSGNGYKKDISQSIVSETADMGELLDSTVLGRLVEILKASSPNLQNKAASVLEFCADIDSLRERVVSTDIEAGLNSVFEQKAINEMESENVDQKPELHALEVEEAGHAISSASRLLTRLLDYDRFSKTINVYYLSQLLRKILKSEVPLESKNWVAACLVKLSSMSGRNPELANPIDTEVTVYETIPRLIEQMKNSYDSPEVVEAAVLELNRIISQGLEVDSTRAIATKGGIFPLVKLIETGTDKAVEAALAILYNLSMDLENHATIISAGAVPALRRIVLSQRSHWPRALHLLRTLPT
ncbi:hypothetical protein Leryth_007717 [Lithospermum erythrorhizon]|nr:hypothetical protein Leryth_007717 [Lithospermum erythrorhizon]